MNRNLPFLCLLSFAMIHCGSSPAEESPSGSGGTTGGAAGSGGTSSAGQGGAPGGQAGATGGAAGSAGSTGGTAGSTAGNTGTAGAAGEPNAPGCELPTAFSPIPTPFSLPAPRCQVSFDAAASSYGPLAFSLLDLTGSAHPDIVVFDDACDNEIGSSRWDVYAGFDGGVAAMPSSYTLPAPRCQTYFDSAGSAYGSLHYGLLDLTGDGRSDIVVFHDACDSTVGTSRWDVYPGGDSGFAATPLAYSIPAPRCQTSFDAAAGEYGSLHYGLLDLTDDGRADLVVFDDACDSEVGSLRWDVYPGGPNGFAPAPSSHGIPTPRCQTRFDAPSSLYGAVGYATLDLTGDGSPDLVVTRDDCDDAIGAQRWDVYAWQSGSFAPVPSAFAVPAPRCQSRFESTAEAYGNLAYAMVDLTCDGIGELVVTRDDCDGEVGTSRWDVYVAGEDGFAMMPSALGLPAPRCQTTFDSFFGEYGAVGYGLWDVTADQRAELVVTRDDCDGDVGLGRWEVYGY